MSFRSQSFYEKSFINEKEEDLFFKEHNVFVNKDKGDKFIMIKREIDIREVDDVFKNIKKLEKKNHPNLVKILKISSLKKNNIYAINVFYKDPKISLKREIQRRRKGNYLKKIFSMEELTHLLYNILEIFTYLEDTNISHGDLSPNSIFYDGKVFKIALIPELYISPEKNQYKKIIKNEDKYISPIIYESVKMNKLKNVKHAPFKSDLFSLGLCILEAGLNESIQTIYGRYKINESILDNKIKHFESIYSKNPLLIISLKKILSINENKRPTFSTLKKALPDYKIICNHFKNEKNQNQKKEVKHLIRYKPSNHKKNPEMIKKALLRNILSNQKETKDSDKELSFDNTDYFNFDKESTKSNPYFQNSKKKSHSSIKYSKKSFNNYSKKSSNYKISKVSDNSSLKFQNKNLFNNYQSLNFNPEKFRDFKLIDGKYYQEVKPVFENLQSLEFGRSRGEFNVYTKRSKSTNENLNPRFSERRVDVYGNYKYK